MADTVTKSQKGRKSKYETHVLPKLDAIKGYLQSGFDEKQVAAKIGIGLRTWYRYKRDHDDLREAVILSGQDAAASCVPSLVKRAKGFWVTEVHTEVRVADGVETTSSKEVKKYFPPNVAAFCVLAFNRLPDEWKDRTKIEHTGSVAHQGVLMVQEPIPESEFDQYMADTMPELDAEAKLAEETRSRFMGIN